MNEDGMHRNHDSSDLLHPLLAGGLDDNKNNKNNNHNNNNNNNSDLLESIRFLQFIA